LGPSRSIATLPFFFLFLSPQTESRHHLLSPHKIEHHRRLIASPRQITISNISCPHQVAPYPFPDRFFPFNLNIVLRNILSRRIRVAILMHVKTPTRERDGYIVPTSSAASHFVARKIPFAESSRQVTLMPTLMCCVVHYRFIKTAPPLCMCVYGHFVCVHRHFVCATIWRVPRQIHAATLRHIPQTIIASCRIKSQHHKYLRHIKLRSTYFISLTAPPRVTAFVSPRH
jgi:hypothetical protein